MTERVIDRVMEMAGQLREQAAEAEKIGRLTDQTTKAMKAAGNIRLLQPAKYNGLEVHPREFAETVMATASLDPAAGWVNGVVGVHPYQLTYADPRVAEEIWGTDADTWVASPYAPQGVAKPVDGGYIFNGRWQFSSGTDQCEWIILGAMLGDTDGKPLMPPQMLHMILPRKDYEIVEDSWNVVGLRGTGSKDVIVKDAFVPSYRTMDATEVMDGTAQRKAGMTSTLYLMPWSTMFPLGITSAVVGIARVHWPPTWIINATAWEPTARSRTTRTSCTRSVRRPPTSTPPDRNCWPTSTASMTSSTRAGRSRSRIGPRAVGHRCGPRGALSPQSTRSSRARAATLCGWTNRCNASGATRTPASPTRSTFPERPTTRRH